MSEKIETAIESYLAYTDKLDHEIASLRMAMRVKRFHTLPVNHTVTVGEHSCQAIVLLMMLHPSPTLRLVQGLLFHDAAERMVGDVPSPALRADPVYRQSYQMAERNAMAALHPTAHKILMSLDAQEKAWIRALDVLELVMYCSDEMMLGNQHAEVVLSRALRYLKEDENTPKPVVEYLARYNPECLG